MAMKIKLIIFDLDGTLVNSSVDITNALNYAVEPYGLEKLTVERTISLVGEGVTRLIEKLLGEKWAALKNAVLERFLEHYSQHLTDFTAPYPGVPETLEQLVNYRMAVISNKREDLSRRLLENLGLAGYFEIIWGSDSVSEKKPSPVPVLEMLKKVSCGPHEAVLVGDSNYDIEAGKAAGVRTVAVSYGFRDVRLLQDADFVIDSMRELTSNPGILNV
ncbi:MAG: HAD-IA family hydrolase [Nitrospirota bacterium]|nr:HAD-IA family hydrolase [Nitrospirota bacterium]